MPQHQDCITHPGNVNIILRNCIITLKPFGLAGRMLRQYENLNSHSGYLHILKLIIRMHISYFLFSRSCLVLFRFCQGLISTNSLRRVRISWLYNETPALQKSSSYHLNLSFHFVVDYLASTK